MSRVREKHYGTCYGAMWWHHRLVLWVRTTGKTHDSVTLFCTWSKRRARYNVSVYNVCWGWFYEDNVSEIWFEFSTFLFCANVDDSFMDFKMWDVCFKLLYLFSVLLQKTSAWRVAIISLDRCSYNIVII